MYISNTIKCRVDTRGVFATPRPETGGGGGGCWGRLLGAGYF